MFITFEGIDGCGKSTQARLLAEHLRSLGHQFVSTREPGGTALAEEIRSLVLNARADESEIVSPQAELLLMAASRAQHVRQLIRYALQRGCWVLCDRFTDSTLAYQGGGLGLDEAFVRSLNHFATDGLQPDLTLLFDLEVPEAQRRRALERGQGNEQADRIESRGSGFQDRVRQAFLAQAAREPERIRIIDASLSIEEVRAQVLQVLAEARQAQGSGRAIV